MGFYMNYNKEAKLTFWRASEVSQVEGAYLKQFTSRILFGALTVALRVQVPSTEIVGFHGPKRIQSMDFET